MQSTDICVTVTNNTLIATTKIYAAYVGHDISNYSQVSVITRSNLSQYYMRHCDNSGRKWMRY